MGTRAGGPQVISAASAHEILDLSSDASANEIRRAYRRLSKQVHPDRGGSHALFRAVRNAYDTLATADAPARPANAGTKWDEVMRAHARAGRTGISLFA